MFNQPNPLDTKICEKISFQFTLYYYIILLQSEPLKLSTKFDENNDSFGSFWTTSPQPLLSSVDQNYIVKVC